MCMYVCVRMCVCACACVWICTYVHVLCIILYCVMCNILFMYILAMMTESLLFSTMSARWVYAHYY